ncbi:MAG: LysM domain-containing protein, partial [bacterium]|nr:LysM domain-containing protein [bacterium]
MLKRSAICLVIMLTLLCSSQAATAAQYTVKSGDTLWSVSKALGVGIEELCRLNNLEDPGRIATGQVLIVSKEPKEPEETPGALVADAV